MPAEFVGARIILPNGSSVIRAVSAADDEILREAPKDKTLLVSVTRIAPPKLRRFYRGLIGKIEQATEIRGLHEDLLVRTGRRALVKVRTLPDGGAEATYEAASTREWDAFEWRRYFDDVMPILVSEVIPGIRWPKFRAEIEEMVRVRLKDALAEGEPHG